MELTIISVCQQASHVQSSFSALLCLLLASFPDHLALLAYTVTVPNMDGRRHWIFYHTIDREGVSAKRTHLVHAIFAFNSKLYDLCLANICNKSC